MRFLRKLRGGVADHDMEGEMTVVWAHGQLDTFYQEDQVSEEGSTGFPEISQCLERAPTSAHLGLFT